MTGEAGARTQRATGHGGTGTGERAVPFYCPYCGEEDLRPYGEHGGWHCRGCARAFTLRFLGLGDPS